MNRLVIIDGNAILHRAFHALPPLTTPDGVIVNAVYGFCTIMVRLIGDLKPSHIAVAFDRPKPTFRKEMFEAYQANRPKMDETLVPQIAILHRAIEAFGISIFEVDGFEADDVIGTMAKKIRADGQALQGIIVTGDRDLLQLVRDEDILIYMPTKGLSEAKLYGVKETVERLGVTPIQIPDYKALAGDSSDNYPGVEGIGPKTAVHLLQLYQTVDALYEAVENGSITGVSAGVLAKLKAGKESAMMSHTLATIRTDVPLDIQWEKLLVPPLLTPVTRETLGKLGFHTLLKRLETLERTGKADLIPEKKTKKKDEDTEQLSLV